MRAVPLTDIRLAGVLDQDVTPDGVILRRLPAWARPQVMDIRFAAMVTLPAGCRLELETDAPEIELDVMLTLIEVKGRGLKPAVFDVVADGELVASAQTTEGTKIVVDMFTSEMELHAGEPTTIRFALPQDRSRRVEIWLPHDVAVELREVRVSDHASISAPPDGRRRWIHYGSSISHCLEAERPTETWPAIAARAANLDLQNLAFAGQCMLDQAVARTIRDLPADVITMKIGINVVNGDTMRERTYGPALHGFLDTVRDGHPTTPIVFITPIICPVAEEHPGPTLPARDGTYRVVPRARELSEGALTLRRTREIATDVVNARREMGDLNLQLFDGLQLFGPDDVADLYDGLHPNAAGYRRIGERFYSLVFESLLASSGGS